MIFHLTIWGFQKKKVATQSDELKEMLIQGITNPRNRESENQPLFGIDETTKQLLRTAFKERGEDRSPLDSDFERSRKLLERILEPPADSPSSMLESYQAALKNKAYPMDPEDSKLFENVRLNLPQNDDFLDEVSGRINASSTRRKVIDLNNILLNYNTGIWNSFYIIKDIENNVVEVQGIALKRSVVYFTMLDGRKSQVPFTLRIWRKTHNDEHSLGFECQVRKQCVFYMNEGDSTRAFDLALFRINLNLPSTLPSGHIADFFCEILREIGDFDPTPWFGPNGSKLEGTGNL